MSGASCRDDGRKMDSILNAMSSASSILKATSSTSGGDDGCKMPMGQGSSSVEEADQGGNRRKRKRCGSSLVEGSDNGDGISLKKGPWTQEEDAILIEHVKNYGAGNWNAVQKYTGLARCGKSCRLRWTNHLKPNLKKGAITAEEEQRIVELHARMGNKWSKMAAQMPGRTDNEIKNFWNTRVKRRQRAGLKTYPEGVEMYRQQVPNGNQENMNPNAALTNEAGQHDSISHTDSNGLPDVEFKNMKLSTSIYDPSIHMPMAMTVSDMLSQQNNMLPMEHPSVSDMLADLDQSTHSSLHNMLSMMHPSKRLRESDMIYNSFDSSAVPAFDQYDTSDPRLLSPCDLIFNTSDQFVNDLTGSHAGLNDTITAPSDPIYGAVKVDLPSVQNFEAQKHIWHKSESSLPPLESVDTPDSSIQFQPNQSFPVTHQNNDGLLETIFYGSKNSNGSNNVDSFQQNNDHFVPYEEIQYSTVSSNGSNNVDSFQQNNGNSVANEALQYFEAQKCICHTSESSLPPLDSVDTPEFSIQFQPNQSATFSRQNNDGQTEAPEPNQSVPVSYQNNDGLLESVIYGLFQENNDHFKETIQNSTLNSSETQLDEQEDLRSSLGPIAASAQADYTITTTQDDGDKHTTLTEFPADTPDQDSQNPSEFCRTPNLRLT